MNIYSISLNLTNFGETFLRLLNIANEQENFLIVKLPESSAYIRILIWVKSPFQDITQNYYYGQNTLKSRYQAKLDRNERLWRLFLRKFWLLNIKVLFLNRRVGTGFLFHPFFWSFCKIFLFPEILSLKLLGSSWDNSYTMFIMLVIKNHFTCDEWKRC